MLRPAPGTYVLWLRLERERPIQVGRLGRLCFPPGVYGYVGSAFGSGGLRSRLGRHFGLEKTMRWHIDYLREHAVPMVAWLSYDNCRHEHEWVQALAAMRGARIGMRGFGSSDCGCVSHLLRFDRHPGLVAFRKRVEATTRSLETVEAAEL